ncbi:hypothetical protein EGW08_015744, partial [Elysia chlorotica]
GTLISGLSVLCCSQVRPKHDSKRHCIWVNAGVGLLQFLLTFLFLLGWIWSITWGLAFLAVSSKNRTLSHDKDAYHHNQHYHHNHETDSHRDHHKHDAPGVSPVPTLPNAVISESESATNSTPVLTIPVPPHPHHHQKRRHNEHVALQPIITLQRVPENSPDSHTDGVLNARGPYSQAPEEKVMRARTRHEKMLQRKMSDNDLSPFVLTNQQLAAIVIHDLPI